MMDSKKRVTHKDVAKLAGVSTAVVSYVINDGPRPTSREVRERVLQAIQELDYHPNAFARGLRAQRTNTIGFLVNDYYASTVFVSGYTAAMLTGLTMHLKEQGYYILVYPLVIGEDLNGVEVLLQSGRLDGVVTRLVLDPPATDPLLELIAAARIPCVCIEQPGAVHFGFNTVTYDNRHGAYEATSYLLAQGHRRIGHICGDLRYGTARARLDGYQQAFVDHGLPIDETLISGSSWEPSSARSSTAQLLSLGDPPTAIFAASDNLALSAMTELRTRHCCIPEDVAVVGFDDVKWASQSVPPLTTVRVPLHEIGRRAAELILDLVDSQRDEVARTEILPVELIRRSSA